MLTHPDRNAAIRGLHSVMCLVAALHDSNERVAAHGGSPGLITVAKRHNDETSEPNRETSIQLN